MMELIVATISFDDVGDRRTIYWYGDAGCVGQLFLEDENLEMDCLFEDASTTLMQTYPGNIWDIDIIPPILCD